MSGYGAWKEGSEKENMGFGVTSVKGRVCTIPSGQHFASFLSGLGCRFVLQV